MTHGVVPVDSHTRFSYIEPLLTHSFSANSTRASSPTSDSDPAPSTTKGGLATKNIHILDLSREANRLGNENTNSHSRYSYIEPSSSNQAFNTASTNAYRASFSKDKESSTVGTGLISTGVHIVDMSSAQSRIDNEDAISIYSELESASRSVGSGDTSRADSRFGNEESSNTFSRSISFSGNPSSVGSSRSQSRLGNDDEDIFSPVIFAKKSLKEVNLGQVVVDRNKVASEIREKMLTEGYLPEDKDCLECGGKSTGLKVVLYCKHVFHNDCILGKDFCPITDCNKSIDKESIIRVINIRTGMTRDLCIVSSAVALLLAVAGGYAVWQFYYLPKFD